MNPDFLKEFPKNDEDLKILDDLILNILNDNNEETDDNFRGFNFNNFSSLFHYTSPAGLLGIISNNSIWFTHYKFLNDKSEKSYCFDLFRQCIENEKHNLKKSFYNILVNQLIVDRNLNYEIFHKEAEYNNDYYIASFSLNGNSLSMWNYYTKTNDKTGYNIKFNGQALVESFKNKSFKHYKVNYNKEKQVKAIMYYIITFNNIWDENKSELFLQWTLYILLDLIEILSLMFKHPAFANEEEYRIVYQFDKNSKEVVVTENLLKFRLSSGVISPYLDIRFNKHCIKGIMISPTQQDEIVPIGLLMLLKTHGYNNLEKTDITLSDIPLRF